MVVADTKASEALLRLLKDGSERGGQAKADALLALRQRSVFVALWGTGSPGFRTLMNSSRVAALPIFTSFQELDAAAHRYGWVDVKGQVPHREIGAREALNHALAHELAYVVVDIHADHSLEISPAEMEPLLATEARKDSGGLVASAAAVSEPVQPAVAPSRSRNDHASVAAPPSDSAARVFRAPGPESSAAAPASEPERPLARKSSPPVSLHAPKTPPSDAVMDQVSDVLRSYPEVEWAAFVAAATEPLPLIGLRLDTAYRARVDEILARVASAAAASGTAVATCLLDNADVVRNARQRGVVFYPWRRR